MMDNLSYREIKNSYIHFLNTGIYLNDIIENYVNQLDVYVNNTYRNQQCAYLKRIEKICNAKISNDEINSLLKGYIEKQNFNMDYFEQFIFLLAMYKSTIEYEELNEKNEYIDNIRDNIHKILDDIEFINNLLKNYRYKFYYDECNKKQENFFDNKYKIGALSVLLIIGFIYIYRRRNN